ncbi:adenylate/guanylate cyclase domain-containing protein [Patescibacteria group bacterium]
MLKTKNLSIMFTDMKGFTARTATHSRKQLHHLLELQDELIKPAIKHYDGTIVKTIGDAFLVTFESPTDGVLCGMKIQENVINHNVRAPSDDQIEVRIAVNSGEVNIKDDDVFGEPVNIASRIEAIAEPNEVYFTEAVYLSMNKNEIPTAEVGHRKLKGIPEEIKVYKVVSEQTTLIRSKLKRQEMAAANANLAKNEVHSTEEDKQAEVKESLLPEKKKNKKDKKSFWLKHKKKIIIAIIIFLIIMVIGIGQDKEKLAQELTETKYPRAELQEKLPELKQDFEQALTANDQIKIKEMIEHIKRVSKNPPEQFIPQIKTFIEQQLDNPKLTPRQKQDLKKILTNL